MRQKRIKERQTVVGEAEARKLAVTRTISNLSRVIFSVTASVYPPRSFIRQKTSYTRKEEKEKRTKTEPKKQQSKDE